MKNTKNCGFFTSDCGCQKSLVVKISCYTAALQMCRLETSPSVTSAAPPGSEMLISDGRRLVRPAPTQALCTPGAPTQDARQGPNARRTQRSQRTTYTKVTTHDMCQGHNARRTPRSQCVTHAKVTTQDAHQGHNAPRSQCTTHTKVTAHDAHQGHNAPRS